MSMMGELNFFLGLQIGQSSSGQTIHQQKYIKELLYHFDMGGAKTHDTPIATTTRLDNDEPSTPVGEIKYRGMIRSLLYLTIGRPDIVFNVGL